MSADRAALLETSIKRRLVDVQRHLAALERAAAGFGVDFDLALFEEAWRSDDPSTLNRANAVQAGYENVINGCIKIAEELAELEGWTARGAAPSSIELLRLLEVNGVITKRSRAALGEAQERRNDVQHDYVNVAAREIHTASQATLEHAPLLVQEVAGVVRRRR